METRWEKNLSKCAKNVIQSTRKNKPRKNLSELTEEEFKRLKGTGFLWEFYPEAPEFYKDIKK